MGESGRENGGRKVDRPWRRRACNGLDECDLGQDAVYRQIEVGGCRIRYTRRSELRQRALGKEMRPLSVRLLEGLAPIAQLELALSAARQALPFWLRAFPEREYQLPLLAALEAGESYCVTGQLLPDAKATAERAYQTVSRCDLPPGDILRSSGFAIAHAAMAPWLLAVGKHSQATHNAMVAINYSASIHEWAGSLAALESSLLARSKSSSAA